MEKLLIKYITGNISLEERKLVVEWIQEEQSHLDQYEALRKIYTTMLWQDVDTPAVNRSFINPYMREVMKVAAILAIVFSAMYAKDFFFPSPQKEYSNIIMQKIYVPPGQRVELTLVDGTHVWLNANTKFSFPNHFTGSSREIELDGEARFEVSHDKKMPFIVKTSNHDVKVLGTEFNVKAYSSDSIFETALMTGSIEVLAQNGKSLLLAPNTKVTSVNNSMDVSKIENMDHYRWTEGLICFQNELVENLIHKMELYYNVKITMNNKTIGKRRYTGKFWTDDGIEQILKVLQVNNNFTYKRNLDTNEYVIN